MVYAVTLTDSVQSVGGLRDWIIPVSTLGAILFGGGGLVAWRRLNLDRKVGIAQQEVAEDDALSKRWREIIESQTINLLQPLTLELKETKDEVKLIRQELEKSRQKYWSAISHIRTLYSWTARNLPDHLEHTEIPPPPAALAEDL